jgi:hypothetical protein
MAPENPEFGSKAAGSKGGRARAKNLSTEEKKAIARQGAAARWAVDIPKATHEGALSIGSAQLVAAVLPNGKRLLVQATVMRAIGRNRSPKAGTGVLSTADGLPFFLQAKVLEPFITDEIREASTPIFYLDKSGARAVGYDARLLQMVAETYLRYRDALNAEGKPSPAQYQHIIMTCDLLMRGLARVGIIALVDEATGYQADRARDALAKILEEFVAKELQKWVSTFSLDYYEQLFRLWEVPYDRYRPTMKRPQFFGTLTNNIVYERLAPGVLEELRKRNPVDAETGRRANKFFQHLTADRGHPKLKEHLAAVTALMRASTTKEGFMALLDKALPKFKPAPLFNQPPTDE